MKRKLLAGAFVLGTMAVLTGCGEKEIDLSKYIEVEFEGVNGKGMVYSYNLDRDKLEDALKDANEDMSNSDREGLMDSIELELKKQKDDLSNGDKVKIDIEWSERRAEKHKIVFTSDEAEIKVDGLKVLKEVDAFKDLEIEYEGVSPFLYMNVESDSDIDFLKHAYYTVEGPNDYIKIGDEVEVTVEYSEYDAEEQGYTVKEEKKKFKVESDDVDTYVEKPEEISEEMTSKLYEAAKEEIQNTVFDYSYRYTNIMSELFGLSYSWDFDLNTVTRTSADGTGFKLDKMAVYVAKEPEDYQYYNTEYNKVTLLIETQLQDSVCTTPSVVYFAVDFDGVVLEADGTLEYEDYAVDVKAYRKTLDELTAVCTEDMSDYNVTEKTY